MGIYILDIKDEAIDIACQCINRVELMEDKDGKV